MVILAPLNLSAFEPQSLPESSLLMPVQAMPSHSFKCMNASRCLLEDLTAKISLIQQDLASRHPDKNPQNSHEAKVRFQKITAAYERLTDQAALSDSDDDDHAFFDEEDEEMMHRAADFFAYM